MDATELVYGINKKRIVNEIGQSDLDIENRVHTGTETVTVIDFLTVLLARQPEIIMLNLCENL